MGGVSPAHRLLLEALAIDNLRVLSETYVDRMLEVTNRPVVPTVRCAAYDRLAVALQQTFEQEAAAIRADLGIV